MDTPSRLRHDRPFTRAQLKASGGDVRVLRRREYVQVFREAWISSDAIDADTRVNAALMIDAVGARSGPARRAGR